MAKVTDKVLVNLRLRLKLVQEEIKQRSKHANANVKGLRRAAKTEAELLRRIHERSSDSGAA